MKKLLKIFIFMVTLFTPITAHAETTSITSTFDISLPTTIDLQKVGDSYAYETEVGVKGELPDNSFINIEINDNVKLYDVTNKNEDSALEDQSNYAHKEPVDVQMGLSNDTWGSTDLNVDEYDYAQLSATAYDISAGSWEGSCTFTVTYVEQEAVTLEEEEESEQEPIVEEEEEPELEIEEGESEPEIIVAENEEVPKPVLEETPEQDVIESEPVVEEPVPEETLEQDVIESEPEIIEEEETVLEDTTEPAITEEITESESVVEEPEIIIEEKEESELTIESITNNEEPEIDVNPETGVEEESECEIITEELESEIIVDTINVEEVM